MAKSVRTVTIEQVNGLTFKGVNQAGQETMMDTKREVGGHESAPTPMETLLMALGGCTGMDVLSILKKMKQPVEDFRIELEGEHAPEHPKVYTKIKIVYIVKGNVESAKLERAIELSQEKYCSVSAMLRPKVSIDHTYEIEPGCGVPDS